MAQGEGDKQEHSAAEKGKGKATDTNGVNGTSDKKEPKKDKDGKIIEDGKDHDKPEELSEEDQQLKDDLEMMVERLQVRRELTAAAQFLRTDSVVAIGAQGRAIPTVTQPHQRQHSHINLVHDSGTEASEVSSSALRDPRKPLQILGREQQAQGRAMALGRCLVHPGHDLFR